MSKWQERLEALGADAGSCADSAISADSPSNPAPAGTNGTIGTNGTAPPLPPAIAEGLDRLAAMPAPRITQPAVWGETVADALRLWLGGWAGQALALGWEPLQLFGYSPGGSSDLNGLAVWLAGRRIILLDDRACIVVNGAQSRAIFTRRSAAGAAFLWEMGRGGQ
jgi:hypothetical protein